MIEIEVTKTQSITNEQLGKYYVKFLTDNDQNLIGLNEDLANAIDMNVTDTVDFASIIEAVADLSWNDIVEVFESIAQNLRKWVDK